MAIHGVDEYRQLGGGDAFKEFLRTSPDVNALDVDRSTAPGRVVDLAEKPFMPDR